MCLSQYNCHSIGLIINHILLRGGRLNLFTCVDGILPNSLIPCSVLSLFKRKRVSLHLISHCHTITHNRI
jgi:hypothetical protein